LAISGAISLRVTPPTEFNDNTLTVTIPWNNDCDDDDESSYREFEGNQGKALLAESKKACNIILQLFSPTDPA